MADTTFVDYTLPAVNAAWLNDVNDNIYDTSTPPAGTFRATLAGTSGAGAVGYSAAAPYAAATAGFELGLRKRVVATGVAATDTAAIQAAVTAAIDYTTIELFGAFVVDNTITVKPMLALVGNGATITFTNNTARLFDYSPGTPTGYPGRIVFEQLRIEGPGAAGSSEAIHIDANCPFVLVRNCFITNFGKGIYLRDAYCSTIIDTSIDVAQHGVQLYRESHAVTLVNGIVNNCTVAALSVNYGGGAGTGTLHNLNVVGGAYQNSATGIWLEQSQGAHITNVYHEGNTGYDLRIGIADAGAYARAAYGTIVDGYETASPCGAGTNIRIEHSVGTELRGISWNAGASLTATLCSYDGFCDRTVLDIFRYTTTTPTSTAPVNFSADPTRGVVLYRGRPIYGVGTSDGIQWGDLATSRASIGHTSPGGRHTLNLIAQLDVLAKIGASGIFRVQNAAGTDQFTVDLVNNKILITPTSIQVPNFPTSNPGAGSKVLWADPADGYRVKFAP